MEEIYIIGGDMTCNLIALLRVAAYCSFPGYELSY